jgi:hypothetical protein
MLGFQRTGLRRTASGVYRRPLPLAQQKAALFWGLRGVSHRWLAKWVLSSHLTECKRYRTYRSEPARRRSKRGGQCGLPRIAGTFCGVLKAPGNRRRGIFLQRRDFSSPLEPCGGPGFLAGLEVAVIAPFVSLRAHVFITGRAVQHALRVQFDADYEAAADVELLFLRSSYLKWLIFDKGNSL